MDKIYSVLELKSEKNKAQRYFEIVDTSIWRSYLERKADVE